MEQDEEWVRVKTTLRDLVLEEVKDRDIAGEKWGGGFKVGVFCCFKMSGARTC